MRIGARVGLPARTLQSNVRPGWKRTRHACADARALIRSASGPSGQPHPLDIPCQLRSRAAAQPVAMALRMRVNALFKKSAPEAPKKAAKATKVTKAGSKKTKGWLGESQGGAVNLDKWYGERRAPAPAREASGQQGGGGSGATEVSASSRCRTCLAHGVGLQDP